MMYQIQAVATSKVGQMAEFNVNIGVSGAHGDRHGDGGEESGVIEDDKVTR